MVNQVTVLGHTLSKQEVKLLITTSEIFVASGPQNDRRTAKRSGTRKLYRKMDTTPLGLPS